TRTGAWGLASATPRAHSWHSDRPAERTSCPPDGQAVISGEVLRRTRLRQCGIRQEPALPSCELLQQYLRLLEVSGLKSLGKPAIDLFQKLPGGGSFALLLPESTKADSRPQLPGLGLLGASHHERLLKRGFRGRLLVCKASQEQLAREAMDL